MSTAFHLPLQPEFAGLFPTFDPPGPEYVELPPRKMNVIQALLAAQPKPRAKSPSAADLEAAELARIALAEDAWRHQIAIDTVDEASMESFPCSDPPAYYATHA